MVDLKLDSDGNLVFDDDLVLVDGIDEFEQRLREWVQSESSEIIGRSTNPVNAIDEIGVLVRRVAQQYEHVDDVVDVSARQMMEPEKYELEVTYEVDSESRYFSMIANR